jgi:hypothetical protein
MIATDPLAIELYRAAVLEADRILRDHELTLGEIRAMLETLERVAAATGAGAGELARYADGIAQLAQLEAVYALLEAMPGTGGEL